ncbi:hypothetical protein Y600_6058 [Burkholderia pseudomallei MSHR3709]|nr:hypothetical protein Y600_6058 [Burkholderia pseudomallei MSHR3709]
MKRCSAGRKSPHNIAIIIAIESETVAKKTRAATSSRAPSQTVFKSHGHQLRPATLGKPRHRQARPRKALARLRSPYPERGNYADRGQRGTL